MANVKVGICPSCGKQRELSYFQFGVIKTTLCIHCLKRYIDNAVIPRMLKNNDPDSDQCLIVGVENGRSDS